MSLEKHLARMQELLPTKAPRVALSLRPPASPEDLARLTQRMGNLPAELNLWFRWHDGQNGNSSLHPDRNETAHSIDSALQAQAFLSAPDADIQAPWDPSWLPLFHNGAGDHLVYAGGPLIAYRHDDPSRPVAFPSLEAWAQQAAKALTAIKPRKIPLPGQYQWAPLPEGRAADFPVGTVACTMTPRLVTRVENGKLVGDPGWMAEILVKLQPDQWLKSSGLKTDPEAARVEALQEWAAFSEKPPSTKSGYYLRNEVILFQPGMLQGIEVGG